MSMRVTVVIAASVVGAGIAGTGGLGLIGAGIGGMVRIRRRMGLVSRSTCSIGTGTYSADWCCAVSAVGSCSITRSVTIGAVATITTVPVALSSRSQVERTTVGENALLARVRARVIGVLVSRTRLPQVGLHRD
jgi:hypothetical protein